MKRLALLLIIPLVATGSVALAVTYDTIGWGQSGDVPVKGDFNGDGTDDIAVFRNGQWYIKDQPPFPIVWGQSGDIPVPADYDGDGTTDIAVWRPSDGTWYIRGGAFTTWGIPGDVPVPADYDEDGKTDIAIFRPSEGRWYILKPDPVPGDVVVAAAGDICSTATDCDASADVVESINPDKVLLLGDNAYPNGAASDYASFYEPNWGRFKSKTMPAPGNHEYQTANAAGYFSYFAGVQPYYSFDLGAWHLVSLNSEIPVADNSAQENWLTADLAANAGKCILAYWHQPRWSSGEHNSNSAYGQLWVDLYAAGADIVLNGHDHDYERFNKQNSSGVVAANGIREFVVGTGGRALRPFTTIAANSEVRNATTFGVLRLTLHASSYDWQFMPVAGSTFTDSGSAVC